MNGFFEVVKKGLEAIVNVASGTSVHVSSDANSRIVINGHVVEGIDECKSVKVIVNGNAESVTLDVGNIEINGDVSGNVKASCGNVTCGKVSGGIHASCGNVTVN